MRRLITQRLSFGLVFSAWVLLAISYTPQAGADFVPVYRGGICVADGTGNCVGGDIRAESGLGQQVGYMKTTADADTVAVYRSTCYSDAAGTCNAWGLSLDVNGTAVGYLSTTAPDTQSASAPLVQSNGLLLQKLGGTASAFLWTSIGPNITSLSVTSGPVGTSVTIGGANFGSTQGTSTVTFNGIAATPTSWSATNITAAVPASATSGPVVVALGGTSSDGVNFAVTTKLAITSVNGGSDTTAGTSFAVVVQSQDASGNPAAVNAATNVSLSLKTGSGTLGGTLTGTIGAGTNQITLDSVTYTRAESGVVLTAARTAGNNLSSGDSAAFTVVPGSASALAFATQPGNATAGSALTGPPTVVIQDNLGNTVTSSTALVTIGIGVNPGGGTLSGTTARSAVSGVASFPGLSIDKAATGYTLTALATGLASATSAGFNVSAAAATKLAFIVQPANATAGSTIAGPPMVAIQDNFGNIVTTSTAPITIAIASNPGGGALSGPTTRNASSGIAVFTGLSINQQGTGYTLAATSSGLTAATSAAFNVSSSSVSLAASPSSVPAGDSFNVTWAQIPNPTNRDWIGLYAPGSADTSYLAWRYVNCSTSPTVAIASGSCSFPISSSLSPGTYEFRLLPNDTYNHIATSNSVTVTTAINKLAVSVNQNVTAGTGFSMIVEARSPSGVATNVSTNTAITVSVKTGTGTLGGTVSGTILTGTSQVTIGLATYTKAESGVVLTAARTSGDTLISGDTAPFTVLPGAPAQLAFTTQPGNAAVKGTIPGPPTVTVQDSTGNTVTSTQTISVAIGNNPSSGILHGNTTVISSSFATFADLSIDQPGNGYTLTASASGLAAATSNPFNITSPSGTGIISGVITRVSTGAAITGALVEAYQGEALRGTAVTNSSGSYSITGLAAGSYMVRASFTGFVPQIRTGVAVTGGGTATVNLALNIGIAIHSPVAGATVNDFSLLVTGLFDTSLAPEVGIQANGYVALQDGNEFAAIVPVDSQTTTVTVTLKDSSGNLLATAAVPITPQLPNTSPWLFFRPSPVLALVSDPVSFTLTSVNPFTQLQLDGNGDGTIDYTGSTLEGVTVTFAEAGLYFPTVSVTEQDGTVRTATSLVQVFDATQLDTSLQNKWTAMKNALRQGDVATAVSHIVMRRRATYTAMFNALTVPFASIDQVLTSITLREQRGIEAEYEMLVNAGGSQRSYLVLFAIDEDGVWRVKFF